MAVSRAPFPWFGGKQALVPELLRLLPPHDVYVEVFGGAASLLFNKPLSRLEVYNDIDSGLVNFFRVLRDPVRAVRLQQLLNLTPFSREEWQECKVSWADAGDDVEMARRWFVVAGQSFAGCIGKGIRREGAGWRFAKRSGHNPALSYRGNIAALTSFTERLATVEIDHLDWRRILDNYDSPTALFYLDPPYLPETRRGGGYTHELSIVDHEELLQRIQALAGKVMLSGYDSALYRKHLHGWHCEKTGTTVCGANGSRRPTVECIWLSPNVSAQQPELPFTAEEVG